MKTAAIYMRVSTAHQEEEQTIGNQKMEIMERVGKDTNVTLITDYEYKDEGWSGAIIERPDLDRMRSDAREGKFEVLYVYDRGRLSRKFVHQEIILEELRECGIECISLHDINGKSTEEVLMGSVMGIFHEYERVKITERMRIGKVRKVRENKKLLGYNPKYGYDYFRRIKAGPDARDGYFDINEQQAKVVKQVFEWIAAGVSKHEVKRKLFKMGIAPPKGKRDQWSGGTLDRMVRDSTYMGDHYYNKSESVPTKNPQNPELKYRKVQKGSRKRRPKEEWFHVAVPAIVSPDLFHKVQVQLDKNKRTNTRNNSVNQYLVAGLIECVCGKARTGDPASNGSSYYRCTDRLSKYPLERECREHGINVPVFDGLVWQNIKELLLNPQLVIAQAQRRQATSPLQNQLDALHESLKKLDDEQYRYDKAYGQNVMSERRYKAVMNELNDKREAMVSEINALEDEMVNQKPITVEQYFDGTIKRVENLSFTEKKAIIKKVITKIVATKHEISIWGRIPLLATPNGETINNNESSIYANYLENEREVGLNVEHWHSRPAQRW
ncbi:MAG: Site-specific recombinase, invertase Pin [Candidatus Saccharibacteria bacterium]|nr:Site-specific recombinase, invertase Pin [Candidatus Saccharibacteria bacterium]